MSLLSKAKQQHKWVLLLTLLLLVSWGIVRSQAPVARAANQVWYVNHAASGNNDGSSWQHAFTDLQDAIQASQTNDQIWVAQGIYYPTDDPSKRDVSFAPKVGVALYGGFVGSEQELDQRDWQEYPTILSGDIDRNDTHTNGVVLDTSGLKGDNSYHVLWGDYLNSTNDIDGFIITAGQANGASPHNLGGGLYNYYRSSPSISNVRFSGNYAQWGGALANDQESNPNLQQVQFSGNYAVTLGGAMYNSQASKPLINNSTFVNNAVKDGGGAIHNSQNSEPMITNSSFLNNTADWGGAIASSNSNVLMSNVRFLGNSAKSQGGALYIAASTLVIHGTLISGNTAASGGAIYNGSTSNLTIDNASIVGNKASLQGGAIYNSSGGPAEVFNSIIWGNSPANQFSASSKLAFSYSLIENCTPNTGWANSCGVDGGNNLQPSDPLFVEAVNHTNAPTTAGNLRLQRGSPAIDAGKNRSLTSTADIADNARIVNSIVDLGAYEAQHYLDLDIVGNGTISYTPQLSEYPMYSTVSIEAIAKPGWSFDNWNGDLSAYSEKAIVSMNSHKKATVTFKNDPPTAHAGANQTVTAGSLVTLDGSGSFDADPEQTLTYTWLRTSGAPVTLSDQHAVAPTFIAPDELGTLSFSLIVNDNLGTYSTPTNVIITVVPSNAPNYTIALPFIRK